MPYIFDSHAHYDDERFENPEALISEMKKGNIPVNYIINSSSDIKSAERAMALAEKIPHIFFTAGIHPHEASCAEEGWEDGLRLLLSHPKCVAMGEIGLDYHYDFSPRDMQKEFFLHQLKIAKELDIPVVIHDREAHGDTDIIVRESGHTKGVLHSFSASAEMARDFVKLGYYISFSGSITFKNAHNLARAAEVVPDHRILIETDAPYLAPVPYRGKTNRSDYCLETAKKLAEIRGQTTDKILELSADNAKRLFGIK